MIPRTYARGRRFSASSTNFVSVFHPLTASFLVCVSRPSGRLSIRVLARGCGNSGLYENETISFCPRLLPLNFSLPPDLSRSFSDNVGSISQPRHTGKSPRKAGCQLNGGMAEAVRHRASRQTHGTDEEWQAKAISAYFDAPYESGRQYRHSDDLACRLN